MSAPRAVGSAAVAVLLLSGCADTAGTEPEQGPTRTYLCGSYEPRGTGPVTEPPCPTGATTGSGSSR